MTWTEDFLNRAMKSEGWGTFENLQGKIAELNDAQAEQAEKEATIVKAALGTAAGQQFLNWLISKTLLRSAGEDELHPRTGEHYMISKAKREGQDQVVFMILQALNLQPRPSPAQAQGQQNEGHQS